MAFWNVRVEHQLVSRLGAPWVHSFQIDGLATGTVKSTFAPTADIILAGFRAGLLSTAEITKITFNELYTLPGVEETQQVSEFGPPRIFTYSGQTGSRVSTDEREGLDRTVIVWKERENDEPGSFQLRHRLIDDDVQYVSGLEPSLTVTGILAVVGTMGTALEFMREDLAQTSTPMVMARWPVIRSDMEIVIGPRGGKRGKRIYYRDPRTIIADVVDKLTVAGVGSRDVGAGA